MKFALALVLSGVALSLYARSMPPYVDEAGFMAKYMQMSEGQSEQYWALRDSMLTPRFKLEDYGITAILLGVGLAFFNRRGLRGPARRGSFLALAVAAPVATEAGYVGDLFLGASRGEFPHWADALSIPLMGVPVTFVILLGWALLHLLFLSRGFRPNAPLRDSMGPGGSYWLVGVGAITFIIVVWSAVLGQYYYAAPGALWLFLYSSLGAASQAPAANKSFKPTPLRGAVYSDVRRIAMKFTVFSGRDPIGETSLEFHDDGMNVRAGAFVPLPGYERVRPVFRSYAEALSQEPPDHDAIQRYYRDRDRLQLSVRDERGEGLDAGTIHISDFSVEAGDDAYEIEVFPPPY